MPNIDETKERVFLSYLCESCGRTIKYTKNEYVSIIRNTGTKRYFDGYGIECPGEDCRYKTTLAKSIEF